MKKALTKKLHVSTSKPNLALKPYGFCCDLKDNDPKLFIKKEDPGPLFSPEGVTGGGPDIKFRLQHTDSTSGLVSRSLQRTAYRSGYRGGYQNGRRKGQRDGYRDGYRGRGGNSKFQKVRVDGDEHFSVDSPNVDQPMICRQCRGPLLWYLEDEINYAREMQIRKKREEYDAEVEKNIKIAIKKEKAKRRKKRERVKSKSKTL